MKIIICCCCFFYPCGCCAVGLRACPLLITIVGVLKGIIELELSRSGAVGNEGENTLQEPAYLE
jgi:hypothetical protein